MADAHGLGAHERGRLLDAILERQSRNARFWTERVPGPGELEPDEAVIATRVEWSRREHAFVTAHRAVFERALL
ncbi:hypothetical protein [Streptomyces sp. NPDC101455]|uniref:hypothetical protein n=1 Tax=Streptomyces sp. NPDC101455 TaxID=3366142 RepID=UPI0037FB9B47